MSLYDIAIIGGGASGLFTAVCARKLGLKTVIIECADRVGKKLLATGNGRCNLTNTDISGKYYNTNFVESALSRYTSEKVITAFKELGLETRIEDGRIYPYSLLASSVLDVLRNQLVTQAGMPICDILTSTTAETVIKDDANYAITTNKGIVSARTICLSTGSNATFGKSSLGLLTALGHSVSAQSPSLCPIPCHSDCIRGLQGIRHRVRARINVGGIQHTEQGEMLFKKDALSGIVAFNLSAVMARAHAEKGTVTIDFLPEYSLTDAENLMRRGALKYAMHKNIYSLLDSNKASHAKCFRVPVTINRDCSQAQVISGGLNTDEFNPITLESKIAPNIYACGESLNVDGLCGGYNLHWAWASAMVVAASVAHKLKSRESQ